MQPTLPGDAIGRAMQGLLPTGHPYRTIVEETLAHATSRGPVQVKNLDRAGEPEASAGHEGEQPTTCC